MYLICCGEYFTFQGPAPLECSPQELDHVPTCALPPCPRSSVPFRSSSPGFSPSSGERRQEEVLCTFSTRKFSQNARRQLGPRPRGISLNGSFPTPTLKRFKYVCICVSDAPGSTPDRSTGTSPATEHWEHVCVSLRRHS